MDVTNGDFNEMVESMDLSDFEDNDNGEIVPEAIRKAAENASLESLPGKSRRLYTVAYNMFKKWRNANKTNSFCEDVLMVYFVDLAKKYAPSSLWAIYSMLKTTINTFDNVNIGSYKRLISYLKNHSKGYIQKKSAVFTKSNISRFLIEAPDEVYLMNKVAFIFGIAGCLRRGEFVNLTMKDVVHHEDSLFVRIVKTKNNVPRSFTIVGPLYDICMKYISLRPVGCTINRFFLRYTKGQCTNQPIGINTFGSMPKCIANFLKLPEANTYTGHSFRRTSATILVDAGADLAELMRHGGWKSTSVAYGYVADSMHSKSKIFERICSGIDTSNSNEKTMKTSGHVDNSISSNQVVFIDSNVSSTSKEIQGIVSLKDKRIHQEECETTSELRLPLADKTNQVEIHHSNSNKPSMDIMSHPAIIHRVKQMSKIGFSLTPQMRFDEQKQVYYDPDIGLYVLDLPDEQSQKTFIFNNCTVRFNGISSTFQKAEDKHQAVQTDD